MCTTRKRGKTGRHAAARARNKQNYELITNINGTTPRLSPH